MKISKLRETLAGAGCEIVDTGKALRVRHMGQIVEIKHPRRGGKIDPNGLRTVLGRLRLRQLIRQ